MRRCRGSAWERLVVIRRGIPVVTGAQTVQDVSAQVGLLVVYLWDALNQVGSAVARGGQALVTGHIEVVELENHIAVGPGVISGRKRGWQAVVTGQGENVETKNRIAVGPSLLSGRKVHWG